jgi:peptidoglycan hydrolase-like protein with peptidoglycan-binding domain
VVTPSWWHREIFVGDQGRDVEIVRRLIAAPPNDTFEEADAVDIRGIQKTNDLPTTGTVDAATAEVLGEPADADQLPTWFTRPITLWETGPDVRRARELLYLPSDDRFDPDAEAAVRRLQSANGLPLTGEIGETEALLLGE